MKTLKLEEREIPKEISLTSAVQAFLRNVECEKPSRDKPPVGTISFTSITEQNPHYEIFVQLEPKKDYQCGVDFMTNLPKYRIRK